MEILRKYRLKALFFITAHMAEKLSKLPKILDLLKAHEIGYHSSSHSVRPTIFEYTDVRNYEEAYFTSLKRETAHINPLTGEVEGKGGIGLLKDLFRTKEVTAYRAPGNCWSPPHLEALADLGIRFDFSTNISSTPVHHKGVTFYPYPAAQHWNGNRSNYQVFLHSIMRYEYTVLDFHPCLYVNRNMWDRIYYEDNPRNLYKAQPRAREEIKSLFVRLELLLKQIDLLRKMKLVEVVPNLRRSRRDLVINENEVQKCYEASVKWAQRYFNREPKYLRSHFFTYFDINCHV